MLLLSVRLLRRRRVLHPLTVGPAGFEPVVVSPAGRPLPPGRSFWRIVWPATIGIMTSPRCPVCQGQTLEIRAKLICRACGMILETCCEGGPMGRGIACPQPPALPAPSAPPNESQRG